MKLIIWLVVAFVVTMPSYLMTRQVVPIGILKNHLTSHELVYGVTNNFLGTNPYVAIGLFVLSLLRGFFMYIVLFVISIMVIFKFRNHIKRKETIIRDRPNNLAPQNDPQNKSNNNKNKKKENRVTKMVLSMSLNYIIGSFLGSLSPILFQIGINSTFYAYYGTVANLVSYLSHGTYIVWYFKFNKEFKNVLLEMFCTEPEEHPVYNARPRLIKPTSSSNKRT